MVALYSVHYYQVSAVTIIFRKRCCFGSVFILHMKYAMVTDYFWRERKKEREGERQTETETETEGGREREGEREAKILFFSQELVIFLPHSKFLDIFVIYKGIPFIFLFAYLATKKTKFLQNATGCSR